METYGQYSSFEERRKVDGVRKDKRAAVVDLIGKKEEVLAYRYVVVVYEQQV